MAELLPNSIADERFRRLDAVAAARFQGIDQTRLLVYLVDHVEASALPALAWQFDAFGPDWDAANESERRALLKRVLARRRKRGTPWAVEDALRALGHDAEVVESLPLRRDGSFRYDGTFQHQQTPRFWFWVAVTGNRLREVLLSVVDKWKRKSTRAAVYFVGDISDAGDPFAYSVTPYTSLGAFDETFDLTFE
jgi:hypothetical protein